VGGLIAYSTALRLTKRGEALLHDAVRRQLRDLLEDARTRFTKLKEQPMAHFVRKDPAIRVLLERGFSADSARSLNPRQGRIVQDAVLRSVRVAAQVDEWLQQADLETKKAQKLKEGGADEAIIKIERGVIKKIEEGADDVIKRIGEAVAALE
jgi:hypothetical protein